MTEKFHRCRWCIHEQLEFRDIPNKPEYCELHIWCELDWNGKAPKPEECPYFESFKEEKKGG